MDDIFGESRVESNNTAEDIVEDNSSADRNVENSGGEIPLNQPLEKPEESKSSEQKLPEDTPVESEDMATDMTEKPSAVSTMKTRGGLTMYERSMMQKEERERKLKALLETLEADFTFAPNSGNKPRPRSSSAESLVSSLGDSPSTAGLISSGGMSVFSRLYSAETAASRGQQHIATTSNNDRSAFASTAASMAGSMATTKTASPRLEFLFKAGEEKLRARHLSDQEEAEQIKRRLENEALKLPGVYTFRPQTKWDLVAQRRKMALEAKEQEADEARQTMPNTLKEVSSFF
jgi:hypothetical protein